MAVIRLTTSVHKWEHLNHCFCIPYVQMRPLSVSCAALGFGLGGYIGKVPQRRQQMRSTGRLLGAQISHVCSTHTLRKEGPQLCSTTSLSERQVCFDSYGS